MGVDAVVVLAWVALVGLLPCYVLFSVVPGVARTRYLVRLSQLRHRLEDQELLRFKQSRQIDETLALHLYVGQPLGSFWFYLAWFRTKRELKRTGQLKAAKFAWPVSNPPLTERKDLKRVRHEMIYEITRATLLGSRFWWVNWPTWLYFKRRLDRGRDRLQPPTKPSPDDSTERLVAMGFELQTNRAHSTERPFADR